MSNDQQLHPEADAAYKSLMGDLERDLGCSFGETAEWGPTRSAETPDIPLEKWRDLARRLPVEVRRIFEGIRVHSLRLDALFEAEERLFGWRDRLTPPPSAAQDWRKLNPLDVSAAYRKALESPRKAATIQHVRWAIDHALHGAQVRQIVQHEVASSVPAGQDPQPVIEGGRIEVRDVPSGEKSFGVRSFLEATPVELVAYTLNLLATDSSFNAIEAWDPFTGGGTVADIVRSRGGRVVASDLSIGDMVTKYADACDLGRTALHQRGFRPQFPSHVIPQEDVIETPNVVFLDPGSRGRPSTSSLYFGSDDPRDLSLLERDEYIETIANIARVALKRIAEGGLVSLIIREGVRDQQRVTPDEGLGAEIVGRLLDIAYVVDRLEVVYLSPVKQVSLGAGRVPTVHYLLARSES